MLGLPNVKVCAEVAIYFLIAAAFLQTLFIVTFGSNSAVTTIEPAPMYTGRSGAATAVTTSGESKDVNKTLPVRNSQTVTLVQEDLGNISKPYFNSIVDDGFVINRTYFRLATTRVSTVPEQFSILGENICQGNIPLLLFTVPSVAKPEAVKERLDIRKTWASSLYNTKWRQTSSARLAFFFGSARLNSEQLEALKNESATFGDIVVGHFVDSYQNLSLKMAVIITWAQRHCAGIEAAVKVDMDTFVNVNLLYSLVQRIPVETHPSYIFGYRHGYVNPWVVRKGAWAVSQSIYPFTFFPRYIYGHSYVISGPAVKRLAQGFPYFPIVHNEDAFVTGVMAVTLNISRLYHESFASLVEKRTFCKMTQRYYVSAIVKTKDREELWNAFKTNTCLQKDL